MSLKQPLATVPNGADKKTREKAIAEAVAKKKANGGPADPPPKTGPPKKVKEDPAPKKPEAKKEEDEDMMSVSDVARELGLDPKRARARLRAAGQAATEGRWPKVKRGSKKHQELITMLQLDGEEGEEGEAEEENKE